MGYGLMVRKCVAARWWDDRGWPMVCDPWLAVGRWVAGGGCLCATGDQMVDVRWSVVCVL